MAEADLIARLTPDLERTLRRYVLGDLEEEARSELEELLVTESGIFEVLGVVEDELIEEYLDGAGAEADRRAFERHFLASPQRLARLRFARSLRDRSSLAMAAAPSRPLTPVFRPLRWQPAWIGLAAALTASLTGNVWLALRYRMVSSTPAAPLELEAPIQLRGGEQRYSGELRDTLEREQSERSGAEARARTPEETLRRSRASVATFALTAGVLRAGGATQQIAVPDRAILVRLRLELAGDDYPFYRAALLDAEGDEVWVASKLKAESEAGRIAVVLVLPAGFLPRGDYQAKLTGGAERGELEAVATYAFRIDTP